MTLVEKLKFDNDGLIPAITQDAETGEVLMMAYMNPEAVEQTLATGKVHYYSRSRQKQWMKGESSGHLQLVKEIRFDCDNDCLLIKIDQLGAACHWWLLVFAVCIDKALSMTIIMTMVMLSGGVLCR